MARKDNISPCMDDHSIKKKRKSMKNKKPLALENDCILEPKRKKHKQFKSKQKFQHPSHNNDQFESKNITEQSCSTDSNIQKSIAYYEGILRTLKNELSKADKDIKEVFIQNMLIQSEGKEVELSCHGTTSCCLELLLTECTDSSTMQRFMAAFAQHKIPVCTSSNASHITETLICYAVKSLQNWSTGMNSEDSKEKSDLLFCLNWLTDFGEFAVENLKDCLYNSYSCHVLSTLVQALAGDMSGTTNFMSKNLKNKKEEFHSQFMGKDTSNNSLVQTSITLEEIPKMFAKGLKKLYKSLLKLDVILDLLLNSTSAVVVIKALLSALKKRLPNHGKKMLIKLAEILFLEKNRNNIPVSLLHKSCSFVIDEMFKTADDEIQLMLWNQYFINCLGRVVTHPVGNFVIQRIFDVIQSKSVFEAVCEAVWLVFDDVLLSQNFGIFVSLSSTCNRLGAQQPAFMKNIMSCLHCYEPEERQIQVLPLLLGFQRYEKFIESRNSGHRDLTICLQGSLVAQAVLKFHKPVKVVHSMISMAPEDHEFLAGHIQGCHVLNAFFGSIGVGEKNKEKLLHHLKPVIISIASDRQKSLTLSRIWVLLSLKLKEIIARELSQNKDILTASSSGSVILKKCGIQYFKHLEKWKEIQMTITHNKTPGK